MGRAQGAGLAFGAGTVPVEYHHAHTALRALVGETETEAGGAAGDHDDFAPVAHPSPAGRKSIWSRVSVEPAMRQTPSVRS